MTTMTTTTTCRSVGLRLDPLDTLFFRDGRPLEPSIRGRSGLPSPQILSGALRTHLLRREGCEFDKLATRIKAGAPFREAIEASCPTAGWVAGVGVRGPWLAREQESGQEFEVLLPAPANLHVLKGSESRRWAVPDVTLVRYDPLSPSVALPGWRPQRVGMRPLWCYDGRPTERCTRLLRPAGMQAFLEGRLPATQDTVEAKSLYDYDNRTGIAVEPDRLTAEEGLIYAVSMLALQRGVTFYAEVELPADAPAEAVDREFCLPFGGEGRRVAARRTAPIAWPGVAQSHAGRRTLVMTTPCAFAARWAPAKLLETAGLVAAAVNGYEVSSGWDLARNGPKPTRFAVPAGSVFFLETELVSPPDASLAENAEDRLQGWGCVLQGVWNHV